jgi:hypothetical protein
MKILHTLLLLPLFSFGGDLSGLELDWLVGCWVTPDGSAQEVWIVDSEGALAGFGVAIGNNRVNFYEVLSIKRNEHGSLVYTAHPAGQASASFTAKEITENSVLFTNADHDYPQEIRYTRKSDHLYATISLLDGADPNSFNKVSCE